MRFAASKLVHRRPGAPALVAAALGLGLAIAVAPALAGAGTRQQPHDASRSCTVPAQVAKGQIVVPLVVDFGGSNGTVLVTCVVTEPGVNGEQLLDDQAAHLGYPQPSYCTSGLIWTIDGYPSTRCPANPGSDNAYWAYWHGGKGWKYATIGPGEWKVSSGDVEGWRYEPDGKANAPRTPSSAAALELPEAPPTTSTSSTPPTTTTTPVKTTSPAAPGTTQTPTTTRPRATSTTTTMSGTQVSVATHTSRTVAGNAAGPRRPSGGSGGSDNGRVSFIVGAVLVLALGAAALVRSRRARLRSM